MRALFWAQRTSEAEKVGLSSFHMTGVAQQWYFMLERDVGVVTWPHFCNTLTIPSLN
jgi:hypothetical protein